MSTVATFLSEAQKRLQAAGLHTARLDVLILLEDTLGKDRAYLLAHPEIKISKAQSDILNTFIMQREQHLPLAYIRGKAAFYGRTFAVTPATLVPRPETEDCITLLLSIANLPAKPKVIDLGTGTGCIGITVKLEMPAAQVALVDIDAQALRIARRNAHMHKAVVTIIEASLLDKVPGQMDVIAANLPYVPDTLPVNRAATHEPAIALFAGADGLDIYKELWAQVNALPRKPTHILTEALPFQHHTLAVLARNAGYVLEQTRGLIQHFARQ